VIRHTQQIPYRAGFPEGIRNREPYEGWTQGREHPEKFFNFMQQRAFHCLCVSLVYIAILLHTLNGISLRAYVNFNR